MCMDTPKGASLIDKTYPSLLKASHVASRSSLDSNNDSIVFAKIKHFF